MNIFCYLALNCWTSLHLRSPKSCFFHLIQNAPLFAYHHSRSFCFYNNNAPMVVKNNICYFCFCRDYFLNVFLNFLLVVEYLLVCAEFNSLFYLINKLFYPWLSCLEKILIICIKNYICSFKIGFCYIALQLL